MGTKKEYTVELSSCGNIDLGQDPNLPKFGAPPNSIKAVASIEEARTECCIFIDENYLGAGNWTGGLIRHNGKVVASVSPNGRVWECESEDTRWDSNKKEITF